MTHAITLRGITKTYRQASGHSVHVFDDFDLDLASGTVTSLIGPSGCGKTTLLNIIAGLDREHSGFVEFPGGADGRRVGYMFQQHRLLPWRTVAENIRLPVETRNGSPDEGRVSDLLSLVGLGRFSGAYPHELSEGMRQRVAFARTLLTDAPLLLLDEPFASVDYEVRLRLEKAVQDVASAGTTVLFVSHDIEEAIVLGSSVIVLRGQPATVAEVREIEIPASHRDPIAARQTDEFRRQLGHLASELTNIND